MYYKMSKRSMMLIILVALLIMLVTRACLESTQTRIPKIIHQTHKLPFNELPPRMQTAIDSWRRMNPGYKHIYYSDEDMNNICMSSQFPHASDAYAKLHTMYPNKGAMRADLFRLLIMYTIGGVYVDVDATPIHQLRKILKDDDEFVSGIGARRDLHQWIIIARPQHQFIKAALEAVIRSVLTGSPDSRVANYGVEGLTGPPIYNLAIQDYTSNRMNITPGTHMCNKHRYRLLNGDYLGHTVSFKYDGYMDDLKLMNLTHWSEDTP